MCESRSGLNHLNINEVSRNLLCNPKRRDDILLFLRQRSAKGSTGISLPKSVKRLRKQRDFQGAFMDFSRKQHVLSQKVYWILLESDRGDTPLNDLQGMLRKNIKITYMRPPKGSQAPSVQGVF